jgi:hypothetical protein
VDDAFNVSQKKKSKSQAWMVESEVRDVCQHRYVLEAARACQRNEEAAALAVDAARLELQSTLRVYDLQTAIKEERQKLIYMRQQEDKEILRQKKASARRLSAIKSNAQSNEEAQLALERNAAERQKAIQAGIARRKAVQKEARTNVPRSAWPSGMNNSSPSTTWQPWPAPRARRLVSSIQRETWRGARRWLRRLRRLFSDA